MGIDIYSIGSHGPLFWSRGSSFEDDRRNNCYVYKVVCLKPTSTEMYNMLFDPNTIGPSGCVNNTVNFAFLEENELYWLYLPIDGDGKMYIYNLDKSLFNDFYINDCIYFKDIGILREERINEIFI